MKKPVIFLTALLLTSCEKELLIDYHDSEPLYVAEATLTQSGARVRLSTTQSVGDNAIQSHVVENAVVVLSCKYYEFSDTLRYVGVGNYTSRTPGDPGITYDMDIYLGSRHFSSSSTMQEEPDVRSLRFVWKRMLTERMLFADIRIQDDPDRNNYYFMQIYRNGVAYRWAVMSDEFNKGGELQQLFQCTTESDMDGGDEDALRENDIIRMEVRAIDRASYDYLYSLQVMGGAGTNPVRNFTGGCMGYFSAYSYVNLRQVFHRGEVEEE